MPYRARETALQHLVDTLEREVASLRGPRSRASVSNARLAHAEAELAQAREELRRSDRAERFHVWIRVAGACTEFWGAMPGSDRVRRCLRCQQRVYDLSALSSAEAARLLRRFEGRVPQRLYRRWDGSLLAANCRQRRNERRILLGACVLPTVVVFVVTAFQWVVTSPVRATPTMSTERAPRPRVTLSRFELELLREPGTQRPELMEPPLAAPRFRRRSSPRR